MQGLKEVYRILADVYQQGSYVGIAVDEYRERLAGNKACLRMVYGTIEHSFEWDYHISILSEKKPKESVAVFLKLGMYCLKYMDSLKPYTVVSEICNLAKACGKAGVVGYINALLRKFSDNMDKIPEDKIQSYSVMYNRPVWLVREYISEYGEEEAVKLMSRTGSRLTHIRHGSVIYSKEKLEKYLKENKVEYIPTAYGFLVAETAKLSGTIAKGLCTVQSLGSIKICEALGVKDGDSLLDTCAAPGGKTVYIAERCPNSEITAWDLHAHRVQLMESYAHRMRVYNIKAKVCDATIEKPLLAEKFRYVLCDVPCSGFGTVFSNPDVVLHKTPEDLQNIIAVQRDILQCASACVAKGGALMYSTCSDLKKENEDVITDFLLSAKDFRLVKEEKMQTDESGNEGYYYALMEKL